MTTHLRITQDLQEGNAVGYDKFGIVGNGESDDSKAVSALAEAIDEGGILKLGGAPQILLKETVTWSLLRGRILTSERSPMPDGVNVPQFLWGGDAYGTMIQLDRVNSCELEGFAFITDDRQKKRAPAGVVLDLDGGVDTRPDPNEPAIGSSCRFRRLRHISNTPDPSAMIRRATVDETAIGGGIDVPAPIFISIAARTQWNQEYHELDDVNGNGNNAGTFLYQGRSPNIVYTTLKNARGVIAYQNAIYMHGGSIHLDYVNLSANGLALLLENASQLCSATRLCGEGNRQWAYIDAPIDIYGMNKLDPEAAIAPDELGRGFIHFGSRAAWVKLRAGYDGGAPADCVVFTFDNDASSRVVDIELMMPTNQRFTRKQLGIDRDALLGKGNPSRQARFVRFRSQPGYISDLPGGHLEFNWPAHVIETAQGDWVNDLPVMHKLSKTPVDYAALTPGVAGEHIDTPSGYIRQRARFDDGSITDTPLGAYKKVKP